jgi:hypothetical protein
MVYKHCFSQISCPTHLTFCMVEKDLKRKRNDFVSIPRSSVLCSICSDVMHAPHHLSCMCAASFCRTCIARWLQKNEKCPVCNTVPLEATMVPCGRQWAEALDSIKRACPMHTDCRYRRGSYAEAQHHAATDCVFRKVRCPNEGCAQVVVFKSLRDHLRLCTLKRCKNFRSPRYGCNVKGTNDFIKSHEKTCVFTEEVLKQIDDLIVVCENVAHDDGNRGGRASV